MSRQPRPEEKRRYKRLDHIFPVEFRFLGPAGIPLGDWREGFTQDISEGGLCLIVTQLGGRDLSLLADPSSVLALNINIPIGEKSVLARARPLWLKALKEGLINQYMVGVGYEEIDAAENRRMLRFADARKLFKAFAIVFTLCLSLGLLIAGFYNVRLRYQNEKLVRGMADNLTRQRNLEKGSSLLELKAEEMRFLVSQSSRKIETLERALLLSRGEDKKKISQLEGSLDFFKKYQEKLKTDLSGLLTQQAQVASDASARRQQAAEMERKVVDKFLRWLVVHQNNATGLVASFEGDADIADWAFTYDQALSAIAFVLFDDAARCRKVLDFYLRAEKIDDGAYLNAYYASTGTAAEYIAHTGPNVWLGLAVLQYTHRYGDKRYLPIAEEIFRWLDIVRDEEGGLRGSKTVTWYSTEHNLDAYAFYQMLYETTGNPEADRRARETLAWLNANAYSRIAGPLVKRGKGDSTIATDTFAWSIAAVGPKKLKEIGMDPDSILEFALEHCCVKVDFKRPEGYLVSVKGFDFSKASNVGRGGVVSGEWTSQMILSLDLMAAYHQALGDEEKAVFYRGQVNDYIIELSKMIITSPSPVGQGEFCLPYASHEFADTGHGWRTPKGNRTGSVASTAYAIFAMRGFNPLALPEE
ncbi:MAG: PilZ domain-containing protein [Candidatus Omnitrophota bacterium]